MAKAARLISFVVLITIVVTARIHGEVTGFSESFNGDGPHFATNGRDKGFDNPGLGTGRLPFCHLVLTGLGGQHANGRELVVRKFLHFPDERNSVHHRHIDIADNQVDA